MLACRFAICLAFIVLIGGDLNAADPPSKGEELFIRRVLPVLQEKCWACHGDKPDAIEGDADLTTAEGFRAGGATGVALVLPGQPDSSPLILAIARQSDDWSAMPPKEADRLSDLQIKSIRDWITEGAPWPNEERVADITAENQQRWSVEDGVQVATSGGLSTAWTDRKYQVAGLWAYQKVTDPPVPATHAHPIDALIGQRMPEGLTPASRADRRTLLRRATFDLLGLPPSQQEIDEFINDTADDRTAFAKVVERLLASPHYGERMAQHWLDVVRYADSSGFANDFERGNAWRYRDYVVRSFNQDKAYDRMILEQIAGDELDEDNPESIIATGFLRMGPWELTGMEVAKIARQRFLDDVTNSVGETFLAHSLQCARCHDHKFDPVPTRDYYAVQAVFQTTQLCERATPFLKEENLSGFAERKYLLEKQTEYQRILDDLDQVLLKNAEVWYQQQGRDPATWLAAVRQVEANQAKDVDGKANGSGKRRDGMSVFAATRTLLQKRGLPEETYPPKLVGFTPEQYGLERVARKGIERLQWELDRYEPVALAVYDGSTPDVKSVVAPQRVPNKPIVESQLESSAILIGGDPFSAGPAVQPGTLSVLSSLVTATIPQSPDGRRLALARWIADANNPLTTRAIANRIWLWHFQQAIAGNPNNFGSTGKRPTHPELLDWLACRFVENGWSFKAMHRLIMSSDAYCRSAAHQDLAKFKELDPESQSFAVFRPRRLSGEELRDAMLFASGELNPAIGGIPVRPEINREVAFQPRQVMGTFAAAWVPNALPQERNRRTLYVLRLRGLRDPFTEVFNAPSPDFSCEFRDASIVAPQVFTLLNGETTWGRAIALAHDVTKRQLDPQEAIVACFRQVYGRKPNADEVQWALALVTEVQRLPEVASTKELPPTEIVREAVEENTGERFTYKESLPGYRDFVPDRSLHELSREARALVNLCVALFNSNEFVYVY